MESKKQKFEYVLDENLVVQRVPVEGEACGLVDCLLNDLRLLLPFTPAQKRALLVYAEYANQDINAQKAKAKETKKVAKTIKAVKEA